MFVLDFARLQRELFLSTHVFVPVGHRGDLSSKVSSSSRQVVHLVGLQTDLRRKERTRFRNDKATVEHF